MSFLRLPLDGKRLMLFEINMAKRQLAGHLLVQCLVEQGVTHAFGVPGESFLAVLDGFHAYQDQIEFVINRQEGVLQTWRKPLAN